MTDGPYRVGSGNRSTDYIVVGPGLDPHLSLQSHLGTDCESEATTIAACLNVAFAHGAAVSADLANALNGLLPEWSSGAPSIESSIEHWEYERSQGNALADRALAAYAALAKFSVARKVNKGRKVKR